MNFSVFPIHKTIKRHSLNLLASSNKAGCIIAYMTDHFGQGTLNYSEQVPGTAHVHRSLGYKITLGFCG